MRRGPYFYRSMLCCDQIDGCLCDVFSFHYTHIFSFGFSSFSIQCAPSDSRKLFSFTYIHMHIQSSISFFPFDKVFIHNFMIFVYTIIPKNSVLIPSFSETISLFIPRKLKSCFWWLLCCFLLLFCVFEKNKNLCVFADEM